MKNAIIAVLLVAIVLLNIALLERKPVNAGLPLVRSDFPICITIKPNPLLRTPHGRVDFRQGFPSNDKGET